jgi:hypothetical protein
MDRQATMRAWLREAILDALEAIDAPFGVLVDAIILPYAFCAGDRSFAFRYCQMESDRLSKEIAAMQQLKRETDVLAMMNRYPSFISDEWLRSEPASMLRYAIQYETCFANCGAGNYYYYGYFQLQINGRDVVQFKGCPHPRQN